MKKTKKLLALLAVIVLVFSAVATLLVACQDPNAEQELANAKTTAKSQLQAYANQLLNDNVYTDEGTQEINDYVAAGIAAIDAAESVEAVANALAAARANLASVAPASSDQAIAIMWLRKYVNVKFVQYTFSSADEASIKATLKQAETQIFAEEDPDAILAIRNTARATIDTFSGTVREYSYRMAPSDLPNNWNSHTYQSASSTYVLDYTTDSLYSFDYNETLDGYKFIPSMASDFPTDVTSQYVGRFGIKASDKNKAWSIPLKDGLKFDNGEPLTAQSFVDSMKLLLNPEAANFRADNVYAAGNLKIYGAENYLKQGQPNEWVDNGLSEAYTLEDLVLGGDGKYTLGGWEVVIPFTEELDWLGGSLEDMEPYTGLYLDAEAYNALKALADESTGRIELTENALNLLTQLITTYDAWGESEEYVVNYLYYYVEYPDTYAFEDVGFFADGNNLVVVLINSMADNFYLRRELSTDFFLVYAPLYEQHIGSSQDVYTNDYATSVDSYVGFGPYKLTQYVEGSTIVMERNPYWWGYHDDAKIGQYITTRVVFNKVTDEAVRREMFEKGELESYGITIDDTDLLGSPYIYYNESESTWYLAMNPDFNNLKTIQESATAQTPGNEVNKTVLTITEFRQALSWSLDRAAFNLATVPTAGVAKALFSSMIIADPDSGLSYRATEEGKDAILSYWGLSDWENMYDEDGHRLYETKDDAIAAITGYDLAGARRLFTEAYNKAVAQNLISAEAITSGKWEVQIVIGMPVLVKVYNNGAQALETAWTNAVKGTPFEGHLVFIRSQELGSQTFGNYLRNGQVDLLFLVGYSGDQFDPFGFADVFTGSLQYDPFTDKKSIDLDIELPVDGGTKTLRASLYSWVSECLQGTTISAKVVVNGEATNQTVQISAGTSADMALRLKILAAVEECVMNLSNVFPLQTDASASLRSIRLVYYTEEYILGVGRGGLRYYTYTFDDAQWAAYIASQGGRLNYLG